MLKLIYKTFLIGILSCSLMAMDLNSKGLAINASYAESLTLDKAKDSDLMSTLTMISIGLLTSRLYSCDMSTDMLVAAAGGAAYIAGEVLATVKLRKVMKDMEMQIARDSAGNINNEQIRALERLKESYQSAKSTAKTKKTLQQAAAVAFLAAAGVAYALNATETAAIQTCDAAIMTSGASCQGLSPSATRLSASLKKLQASRWIQTPSSMGKQTEVANSSIEQTAEKGTTANATSLAVGYNAGTYTKPLAIPCEKAVGAISAACSPVIPTLKATGGYCPAGLSLSANINNPASYYVYGTKNPMIYISLLFGSTLTKEAKADLFSPLGIVGGAAVAYLMYTTPTLGVTIDSNLLSPMNRAIIWGVLAGLVYMASTATDNVIAKIDANIMKIDAILMEMNTTLGQGTNTSNVTNTSTTKTNQVLKTPSKIAVNNGNYDSVDLSGENGGTLPCFTGGSNGKCATFSETASKTAGFGNLDLASQEQIMGLLKTSDGLQGTSKISGSTISGAAQLASSSNALSASVAKAKKDAQESLLKSGSKINLDDEAKKFSGLLEKNVRDGLKKSNTSAASMMASISGGTIPAADAKTAKTEGASTASVSNATPALIDIQSGAATTPTISAGLGGLGTSLEGDKATEEAAKSAQALNDFELKNTDITTDTSSSIFDLISNRYQQSGYPRLFKVKEPASVPVKK